VAGRLAAGARFARRWLRRRTKRARRRLAGPPVAPRALFVVGCQRSGTTLVLDVLERSPDTWVYQEYDRAAFRAWKLRPLAVRRRLVEGSRFPWVVFKPLFDAQRLDELLAEHPGSRAAWVQRGWRGVAASSARKWGTRLPPVIERLAREDPCDHWMADRLPAERRAQLAELLHPALSVDSAAALRWWLRNQLYFDLALHERRGQVIALRYEELVTRPERGFGALFDFLGLELDPAWLAHVSPAPARREPLLDVDPAVAALCDALEGRLAAAAQDAA
jgi:hypothetical protein